jgi:8-oxo-dGTP diphosphatase
MKYTYEYPRPAVTVDIIVLNKEYSSILLIKRNNPPFINLWALPGGFVDENEPLINAAHRELDEETSISNIELKQFHTFGNPGRDPRGHTVSIVYWGVLSNSNYDIKAGDDASDAQWFKISELLLLAFDHAEVIEYAFKTIA